MGKNHFTQKLQLCNEVVLLVDRMRDVQSGDFLTLGLRDQTSVVGEPVGAIRLEEAERIPRYDSEDIPRGDIDVNSRYL